MIFNIFGGLVKSLGVYRHSPLLLAVFLIIITLELFASGRNYSMENATL